MAIEVETAQELANLLREGGYYRVGIDGIDGCGKTTLAKYLAEQLKAELITLDDYLIKNQGSYLSHFRYEDFRMIYCAQPRCIVEGVCLLDVLETTSLEIDTLVYVKRMQHGVWADERDCDITENVDSFVEKERELEGLLSATREVNHPGYSSSAILHVEEEIIRYHASYKPFTRATFWYLRDDCRCQQ